MEPGISFFCLNSKGYLPQPPRAWSRVQNSCSLITGPEEGEFVQVPYSKKIIPYEELDANIALLRKGNVLQYKKNSSNLTKQQRYSLIAKGQWTNRTKTWATQSDRGYTNPNNQSYIRVGATNVTLAGVPTALPVTCPRFPIINNGVLPVIAGGGSQENILPPPVTPAPNAGGDVIPLVPVITIEPIVIQDFGNLVCGTFENLCTGEIIRPILLDNCHSTTDSDVPGPIEELCWNDGNPTWYPRQRYVMSNSTDKWPVNAQLASAIIFDAPELSATMLCNVITLSWPLDIFYTIYNIYQDEYILPIEFVNGFTNTFTVNIDVIGTYSFYIKGINCNIESEASNTVSVSISQTPSPFLTINTVCNVATLNWNAPLPCNLIYQVYENGVLIDTTTNTTLVNILLDAVGTYDFYVIAFLGSIASVPSNTVSVVINKPNAPVLVVGTTFNPSNCNWNATLTWDYDFSCNYIYKIYENDILIGIVPPDSYPFVVPISTLGNSFYVIVSLGSIQSDPSNTVTINTLPPPPAPINLTIDIVYICTSATLSWTAPALCNFMYEIYDNNTSTLIGTTTSTSLPVTLDNCRIYSFYVVAVLSTISSAPSNTVSAEGLVTYNITSLVNTSYTTYSNNGYTGIVFDNNNSTAFTTGTALINFCKNVNNASILIVGGGGGGGSGDTEATQLYPSGGSAGSGGAITYLTGQTISGSTNINLTIGFGGAGRTPGNQGQGAGSGQSGTASLFSTISSGGGSGGSGIGGGGAGPAGSSNSSSGGGGGGGGGAYRTAGLYPAPGVTNGGLGGSGLSGVNPGTNGSNAIYDLGPDPNPPFTPADPVIHFNGGNGGASGIPTVTLPFTPSPVTLNLGGGGGGGGSVSGGGAGNGTGGVAGTSVLGNYYGDNALYGIANNAYGGGGGGGGIQNYTVGNTNIGGNGGNGTVIIWWPTC
jgi:hypothetical protein